MDRQKDVYAGYFVPPANGNFLGQGRFGTVTKVVARMRSPSGEENMVPAALKTITVARSEEAMVDGEILAHEALSRDPAVLKYIPALYGYTKREGMASITSTDEDEPCWIYEICMELIPSMAGQGRRVPPGVYRRLLDIEPGELLRLDGLQVLYLFREIARAIDAVHKAGFVHQDINLSNIMIAFDDRGVPMVKLYDFSFSARIGHRIREPMGSARYAPGWMLRLWSPIAALSEDQVRSRSAALMRRVSPVFYPSVFPRYFWPDARRFLHRGQGYVYDPRVDIFAAGKIYAEILFPDLAAEQNKAQNRGKIFFPEDRILYHYFLSAVLPHQIDRMAQLEAFSWGSLFSPDAWDQISVMLQAMLAGTPDVQPQSLDPVIGMFDDLISEESRSVLGWAA